MKIKQRPEDFRVEEVSLLEPGTQGVFRLYRLEKEGIGTLEALAQVARTWRLPRRDCSSAGLKDRYGRTGQVISIRHGPHRNLATRGIRLNYLGRSPRPAARGTIAKNRFTITVRHLQAAEADLLRARAEAAARWGLPNYFDDQRFGSLRGTAGVFIARALLDGDAEGALRLAIASPAPEDRSAIRRRRRLLRARWGNWEELARALDPCRERGICASLAGGATFARAYEALPAPLRALHLAAYQAHLFNACLRRRIGEAGPVHAGAAGPYRFFRGPPGALAGWEVPLASPVAAADPDLDAVLAEEGLSREDLGRLPFRASARPALARIEEFAAATPAADELNRGRLAVTLSFALRPGAYATMLVKRCTYDMHGGGERSHSSRRMP